MLLLPLSFYFFFILRKGLSSMHLNWMNCWIQCEEWWFSFVVFEKKIKMERERKRERQKTRRHNKTRFKKYSIFMAFSVLVPLPCVLDSSCCVSKQLVFLGSVCECWDSWYSNLQFPIYLNHRLTWFFLISLSLSLSLPYICLLMPSLLTLFSLDVSFSLLCLCCSTQFLTVISVCFFS